MFGKVLIANRGEIACRIIRTARDLGVASIAVVSEADTGALHAALADEVAVIGPPEAAASYLNGERILDVARELGAEAIHPGYGFLAENADFAEACNGAGIKFIGPALETIRVMGQKHEAKAIAEKAGVPVVPGFMEAGADRVRLAGEAHRIGLPLMVKAVAGGGGRGMRLIERDGDIEAALESAAREAEAGFGDGRLLLEKFIGPARHVEVQIFGDGRGHVVHLFERDCSLQRRHQKVVEEAPAPGMTEALRAAMTGAAVALGEAVAYEGAGTVEFLLGAGGKRKKFAPFYFMEMNTRLQVEHPVTEMVTGEDLVAWQFRIAAGEPLPRDQDAITLSGHAIEVRLYAEDPDRGFQPSSGRLMAFRLPGGEVAPGPAATTIRVDTGVISGDEITPYYDPLLAKVIAHAKSRGKALTALAGAIGGATIIGPRSNAGFLRTLLGHGDVRAGAVHTNLIAERGAELTERPIDGVAVAAGVAALLEREWRATEPDSPKTPFDVRDGFQLGGPRRVRRSFLLDGERVMLGLSWMDGALHVALDGETPIPAAAASGAAVVVPAASGVLVWHDLHQLSVAPPDYCAGRSGPGDGRSDGLVRAPINGRIASLQVSPGDHVEAGATVAVVEAMKMEHIVTAPIDGLIAEVATTAGAQLREGDLIARITGNPDLVAENTKS